MTVKEQLLSFLEAQGGRPVSGQNLADRLGCSRNAVWKAIQSLQAEGHRIESSRQGYRLVARSRTMTQEGIRVFLNRQDVRVEVYDSLPSTNRTARELALAGKAGHGSVICAKSQEAGRGRRGKSFFSPPGSGIYFSVILEPRQSVGDSLRITTSAAVAVYRAVREWCGTELDMKWVNDLYRNGKKVCGILTEAVTDFESGQISHAIVGIGINLYIDEAGLPPELAPIVGGIFDNARGCAADPGQLIAGIVNHLLDLIENEKGIPEEYFTHNLMQPGTQILCFYGGQDGTATEAEVAGILPDGQLQIRTEEGEVKAISFGEVSLKVRG